MRKIAALLAFTGTACSTMQVQHAPTPQVVSEKEGRHVRVTLQSGQKVEIFDATLRGDSIVGFSTARESAQREERRVATADVTEIAVQKFSVLKTVVAVGVMVAAVAIITGGSSSQPSNDQAGCAPATVAPPPAA